MFKLHEFRMKNGTRLYGYLSRFDADSDTVYVLGKDEIGLIGKDGRPVRFADCAGMYCETTRPGVFDSEEQMARWLKHGRSR